MPFRTLPDLSRARILVTNDDGVHAPGLRILTEAARAVSADVWVVAPEWQQSGAGHSLSLHDPLRLHQLEERRFSVSGTPTDCVLVGVMEVLHALGPAPSGKVCDLVVSGVNAGANLADDVTYSGTIAAAMEATLLDIPAIAFSQKVATDDASDAVSAAEDNPWLVAEAFTESVLRQVAAAGMPPGTLMNVNFPYARRADAVRGLTLAPQGRQKMADMLHKRLDPRGRPYFWIDGALGGVAAPGTDAAQIHEGYITVTPLSLDLTDYQALEQLRSRLTLAA